MLRTVQHILLSFGVIWAGAFAAQADVRLVMVEEPGCYWCARWEHEIGDIYPKTSEGRIAPLRKIEIHGPEVKDFALKGPPAFTPTFILVDDNTEIGRLEGYPGDEFFWTMIQALISKLPAEKRVDPAF